MIDAGFDDHFHRSAEGSVALLEDGGVLGQGHDLISIADDAEDRHSCSGQGLQVVDGIELVGISFIITGEAVDGLAALPVGE